MLDKNIMVEAEEYIRHVTAGLQGPNFGDLLPRSDSAGKVVRRTESQRDETTLTLQLIQADLYEGVYRTLMRTIREIQMDLAEAGAAHGEAARQDEHLLGQAVAA